MRQIPHTKAGLCWLFIIVIAAGSVADVHLSHAAPLTQSRVDLLPDSSQVDAYQLFAPLINGADANQPYEGSTPFEQTTPSPTIPTTPAPTLHQATHTTEIARVENGLAPPQPPALDPQRQDSHVVRLLQD